MAKQYHKDNSWNHHCTGRLLKPHPLLTKMINPENQTYLPATSIISTVLIAGMDAPTSRDVRKDLFIRRWPWWKRMQFSQTVSRRYTWMRNACSWVRWFVPKELISDRSHNVHSGWRCRFEAPLVAYAVGEDGKPGVRGRLVTKQGQYTGTSPWPAGFLTGCISAL